MNTLSTEKKISVLSALVEGNSIRSISRMTDVDRNTISSLLLRTGDYCADLKDGSMRNLRCCYVQCDEIWCYVGKKDRRVREGDSPELGSQWVFVAMDEGTKLVPVYTVGKRTEETTWYFVNDLAERLTTRIQLTTDGYIFYRRHVEDAFGSEVDFAQLIKLYGDYGQRDAEAKYSPNPIKEVISKIISGDPEAACALHFAHYNFCRVHSSLRVTPAMAAEIASEIWPLQTLLD